MLFVVSKQNRVRFCCCCIVLNGIERDGFVIDVVCGRMVLPYSHNDYCQEGCHKKEDDTGGYTEDNIDFVCQLCFRYYDGGNKKNDEHEYADKHKHEGEEKQCSGIVEDRGEETYDAKYVCKYPDVPMSE